MAMMISIRALVCFGLLLITLVLPCNGQITAPAYPDPIEPINGIQPRVRDGWNWSVVATTLRNPRSIIFDTSGKLLMLEARWGIITIAFDDNAENNVIERERLNVVRDASLNHGLALSPDGKTLYASSTDLAWSWDYDTDTSSAYNRRVVVKNMNNADHDTRTLLVSQKAPNMLVVSRGSNANIDPGAADISSGRAQIRAFDMNNVPDGGYDFATSGLLLGHGLRNSVGIAEHPETGGIWSVENSIDGMTRNGVDIHNNNPGEELNFLGRLMDDDSDAQGSDFGYPNCFAMWDVSEIPRDSSDTVYFDVGTPFSNATQYDDLCSETTAPLLTWQAHMAPLDIKFNNSGTEAYISFHGSWDRSSPVGYKVGLVHFTVDGDTVTDQNSTTSVTDIFANEELNECPGRCFRPVGLAFDDHGRLFVTSDATNETYLIVRNPREPEEPAALQ